MKKRLLLLGVLTTMAVKNYGQVIYSENFENLTFTSEASAVPANMIQINADGFTAGGDSSSNAPFHLAAFANAGWAIKERATGAREAVSTPVTTNWYNGNTVLDRWLITPPISGLNATTVLSWLAYSDYSTWNYGAGYEVWVSAAAGASANPVPSDFTSSTSNRVFTISNEIDTIMRHHVSLSSFSGQTVRVAFRNKKGQAYRLFLDDIVVNNAITRDVEVSSVTPSKRYQLAGTNTVKATVRNWGSAPLTSVTLRYAINGGTPVTQTFSLSPALYYADSIRTVTFSTVPNLSGNGLKTIHVWATDVNGLGADPNAANDSAKAYVSVLTTKPPKKVLLEENTGTWCGYCPSGATAVEWYATHDTAVIAAAHHIKPDDEMTNKESNEFLRQSSRDGMDGGFITGYPNLKYDRTNTTGGPFTRKNAVVPATVALTNVSYNSTTRLISATVKVTFVEAVRGDFAINCYATENHVYGPLGTNADNGYNQHSYFYDDSTSSFFQIGYQPNPVNSPHYAYLRPHEFTHNYLVENMMGGAFGDRTVIPNTVIPAGTVYTKNFSYTLPPSNPGGAHRYNEDNIHIVGMVQECSVYNKYERAVLNACTQKLTTNPEDPGSTTLGVKEVVADFGYVLVYPNPAANTTNIALELKEDQYISVVMYNATGQMVKSVAKSKLAAGVHNVTLDLENLADGIYSVVIQGNNGTVTQKVIVSK